MPNIFSSKEIISVIEKKGFIFISQKGSHGKYKDNNGHTAIIPVNKKEIPEGTFRSILKQADLSLKEFKAAL